jgi:hypothetical protein
MKARQKRRMAGLTTGCWPKQASCIKEKQQVRPPGVYEERERIRVREQAVRYTQKGKQTNMHTCVSVYVYVYEERERLSVTLVTTNMHTCVSVYVYVYEERERIP